MTSNQEHDYEQKRNKLARRLQMVCEGGLESRVHLLGGALTGFSVKAGEDDYLMTLRAEFEGSKMISFVGASTLANLLLKAHREAAANRLRWKADKWD